MAWKQKIQSWTELCDTGAVLYHLSYEVSRRPLFKGVPVNYWKGFFLTFSWRSYLCSERAGKFCIRKEIYFPKQKNYIIWKQHYERVTSYPFQILCKLALSCALSCLSLIFLALLLNSRIIFSVSLRKHFGENKLNGLWHYNHCLSTRPVQLYLLKAIFEFSNSGWHTLRFQIHFLTHAFK